MIHGRHDHQLKIDGDTKEFTLARDTNNSPLYEIFEEIPKYREPLLFTQKNWIGGHGQYNIDKDDMYFEGQSIDTTQDGRLFLGPLITEVKESDDTDLDSAPVCFCWFSATSELLCATSGKIYRYDVGSNGKWTAATTTVAGVTHLCEHDDIMYAAVGTSTKYYYSSDGDTWTQTDLSDGYAERFLSAQREDGSANVLWKFKQPNEMSRTTDGRTVAAGGVEWVSPIYIGHTSNNITNIFLLNDYLMAGREDGLFHYDTEGGVHPLRTDLKISRDTQNFKYVTNWQTGVYHSEGTGLGEMTSYNTFEPMGPLTGIDDIGKVGTCVGLSADKDWIYCAMDEGTNTIIYKIREVRKDNQLRWERCPWVFLGTEACATIEVAQHSSTDRRLWFGYGNSTAYVILTDNPTADSAARFAASGWIRMSYEEGSNLYWDKMWQSIVTQTKACTANLTVTPKYRKDTDTTATVLTPDITTNGTVKTNLSNEISCNRIQFELHLATNDSTATPEVLLFEVRGKEKPETERVHEATYRIGTTPSEKASTIKAFLEGGRTSTSLVKFADLNFGESTTGSNYKWVVMEPGYPQVIEITHQVSREPEMGIKVRLREVSFTIS